MLNSKYFPIIWIINDNYGGQSEVPPWTMMKDRTAGIAYAKGSQMTLTWGPQKGRFFRIYLMAAQLQHALITFIHFFFPSFWLSPLPYPFIFPLFVFSRYLSIITFSLSLILSCTHSLITPPTSPLHNQSSLSTLSLSLKIKTKHVLCHIPSGTRRVARKIGGVQDQRQGQAWPQDPSHYRQILPR